MTATQAAAQPVSPDAAAAQCRQWFDSVDNIAELSGNPNVLVDMRRCMDLGIDPPLKARPDFGRHPARGVARSQIPNRTCPPFETCLYSARVNTSGGQALNYGMGGTGSSIADMPVSSAYSAPQFIGHLPPSTPQHLREGGTIYFYGSVRLTPPNSSLIYEDKGMNYYSDGSRENIRNGHVMVPPPDPRGAVMEQKPVIVNQTAKINFDDGGVMVMPSGFSGTINGQNIVGGDIIIVDHAEDMLIPSGTRLYPFPQGSHQEGAHVNDKNYVQYNGPPIQRPNAKLTITNKNQPGVNQWW